MPYIRTREKVAEWALARYHRRRLSGVCVACSRAWKGPTVYCRECLDRKRPLFEAKNARRYAAAIAGNRCVKCNAPLHPEADAGRRYCTTCSQQRRSS